MTMRWGWSVVVVTVLVAASGCGAPGGDDRGAAPREITGNTVCALDGMLLADYPGPKAQIWYAGHDQPDDFCDLVEMFRMYLKP